MTGDGLYHTHFLWMVYYLICHITPFFWAGWTSMNPSYFGVHQANHGQCNMQAVPRLGSITFTLTHTPPPHPHPDLDPDPDPHSPIPPPPIHHHHHHHHQQYPHPMHPTHEHLQLHQQLQLQIMMGIPIHRAWHRRAAMLRQGHMSHARCACRGCYGAREALEWMATPNKINRWIRHYWLIICHLDIDKNCETI